MPSAPSILRNDPAAEDRCSMLSIPHSTIFSPALFNYFIHFFSVQNTENQYLFAFYPEYNTIIPHTEFPVPFQCASQGLSVVLRCNKKSRLDCSPDSCGVCIVQFGKILIFNRWMIFESIGHAKPIPPCGPKPLSHLTWFPSSRQTLQEQDPREAQEPL